MNFKCANLVLMNPLMWQILHPLTPVAVKEIQVPGAIVVWIKFDTSQADFSA